MSAKDSAGTDVVADVQKGYAFDGPALELGALVVDGTAHPDAAVRIPLGDAQPARPGRRRHRHGQDQDAAADGRAAVGGRRPGDRRRHQGRPVRHRRAGRGQRPDDEPGHRGRPELDRDRLPGRAAGARRPGRGADAARHDDVVRPDPAGEGARPQRGAGVVARPGVPLRRQGRPAAARPQGPARRRAVPHQRRGQGRAQGARRPLARDRRRDPARAHLVRGPGCGPVLRRAGVRDHGPDADRRRRAAASCRCSSSRSCRTGPRLFSTFLMWLLADLFHELPEVGDVDKPKLVFFFDEAHLLFDDASKEFLDRDRADRAADPVQGRRRLLRHPDPQGRAVRRPRAARQPGPARPARVHPRRREGAQGDGLDVPQLLLRPRGGADPARHRRGDRSRCSRTAAPRRRWRGPGCARRSR